MKKDKDIRPQGPDSLVASNPSDGAFSTSFSCMAAGDIEVTGPSAFIAPFATTPDGCVGAAAAISGAGLGMAASICSIRRLRALPDPVVRRKLAIA